MKWSNGKVVGRARKKTENLKEKGGATRGGAGSRSS